MKICIVTHEYPPNMASGPGSFVVNLVGGLLSAGHSVTVITPFVNGGERHEKKGGLEVYRIDLHSRNRVKRALQKRLEIRMLLSFAMRGFKKNVDLNQFDLLHIVDAIDSYFIDESIRIPVIVSVNDIYSFITPLNYFRFPFPCTDKRKRYVFYNLNRLFGKKYIRRADFLITNSHCLTNYLAGDLGIPEERIATIYRGVDNEKFGERDPSKHSSREILFVGGNMERKGVRFIVQAMPDVIKAFPDAHFTIIGKAGKKLRKLFMKTIKKHSLQKNITFVDYVSRDEIPKYYAKANIFVLNSGIEIDVGLSQSLLEAMSSGTPVICTDDDTNRFAIGNAGLFVKPRDSAAIARAINILLGDRALAERLGNVGYHKARDYFHKDRMVDETIRVYEKVAAEMNTEPKPG